jgi:radical SAM protein with 4Fe4S-binding SPASM domain
MRKIRTAYVHLTNKCNNKCLHCFADSGENKTNGLPTKELIDLIRQIKKYDVEKIVLEGGEPFLRQDIYEIVDSIYDDVKLAITTNVSKTDDRAFKKLKGKVQRFGFSLDGATPETHDFLRQRKGSFNETINGIKKALKHGYEVNVWYTVSKPNLHEVQKIPELLGREYIESVDLFCFFSCSNFGRARDNWNRLAVSEDEWNSHLKTMEEITKKFENIMFEPTIIPRTDRHIYEKKYSGCNLYQKEMSVHVDSTGNIHICPLLFGTDLSLGNIRNDTFENIWEKSKTWEIFETYQSKVKESCGGCKDYSFCKGGCPAYSLYEGFFKKDSRCTTDSIPLCSHFFYRFGAH